MTSKRQRNAARTRVGLLSAALARMDDRSLADIPVKELCDEVGVSQATFFNYFDSKDALLVFFVQLWSVEMAWLAARHDPADPLGAIEALLVHTAHSSTQNPGAMAEIIALQARRPLTAPTDPPSDADLVLVYPDHEGILDAPRGAGLDAVVPPLLAAAIARGQLPPHTDVAAAFVAIAAVFFGGAVVQRQAPALPLAWLYRRQLTWLWTALRQEPAPA